MHARHEHVPAGNLISPSTYTLASIYALENTFPDLLSRRRGKYGTSHSAAQQSWTNKSSEGGLMTRSSTRDDRDLRLCSIRTQINNLLLRIESSVGVCESYAFESTGNESRGIIDEMFRLTEVSKSSRKL